jgi:hypothetical protein
VSIYAKFIVAGVLSGLTVVLQLTGNAQDWVIILVQVLNALGVYAVPNARPVTPVATANAQPNTSVG